jgi:hypothetical protein
MTKSRVQVLVEIPKRARLFLGSAGSLPASSGSLPELNFVGKLPTNAGWQPALPKSESPL